MALLTVNNASFGYEGRPVIQSLQFSVEAGDYLCIVGENGAGKSTLVRGLLNLIRPLSGTVTLGEHMKRREIGYLPQQSDVQRDFPASVYEVVLSGRLNSCGWRPFFNKEDRRIAEENLRRMEISDLRDQRYQNLSGGQQQRVLLARALCATTAFCFWTSRQPDWIPREEMRSCSRSKNYRQRPDLPSCWYPTAWKMWRSMWTASL